MGEKSEKEDCNMGKIIMCGSFKGGVGKTASSWNLAYSLASMGKKVLAVDFDSQANLTTCLGIEDPGKVPVTIGHLMMNRLEEEVKTETLELTSTPLPNGMVKVKTGSNTEDTVYNNWYKSVYQTPATSVVSEAQG